MKGARLATQEYAAVCNFHVISFKGCFNCLTGGKLKYRCHSSVGTIPAVVTCRDYTNFVAKCDVHDKQEQITLVWDHSRVETICQVECGGTPTTFPLNGTLIYLNTNWDLPFKMAKIEEDTHHSLVVNLTWPHVEFWASSVLSSTVQKLLGALAGMGFLALFYLFIKFSTLGISLYARLYRA